MRLTYHKTSEKQQFTMSTRTLSDCLSYTSCRDMVHYCHECLFNIWVYHRHSKQNNDDKWSVCDLLWHRLSKNIISMNDQVKQYSPTWALRSPPRYQYYVTLWVHHCQSKQNTECKQSDMSIYVVGLLKTSGKQWFIVSMYYITALALLAVTTYSVTVLSAYLSVPPS